MKQIEQTSLVLLFGASALLVLVVSFYIFDNYLKAPSLFIPPAEHKSRTTINMVLEAESLEGLKKICTLWASQKDRESDFLNVRRETIETTKRDMLIYLLFTSLMFALGSAQIFVLAKRAQKESKNAL